MNYQVKQRDYLVDGEREIYLAGGCFWGVEAFFKRIDGINALTVGYGNGVCEETSYEKLGITGHAETVHIIYNPIRINLTTILAYYFQIIDPISVNRQGPDVGRQYRTGIFYKDKNSMEIARKFLACKARELNSKLAVIVEPLENYVLAEDYHQDYLDKNPAGYCHVNLDKAEKRQRYFEITKTNGILRKEELTKLQYNVVYENGTEPPFQNEYCHNFKRGIYVDVTNGEPLFSSAHKFESGSGWPSFSMPITKEAVCCSDDTSFGMIRTQVRSTTSDIHLGHLFDDGPKKTGGKRYCINSAALKFIPFEEMEEEGYGKYMPLV